MQRSIQMSINRCLPGSALRVLKGRQERFGVNCPRLVKKTCEVILRQLQPHCAVRAHGNLIYASQRDRGRHDMLRPFAIAETDEVLRFRSPESCSVPVQGFVAHVIRIWQWPKLASLLIPLADIRANRRPDLSVSIRRDGTGGVFTHSFCRPYCAKVRLMIPNNRAALGV